MALDPNASVGTDVASGAVTGASAGMMFGPWGALLGGLVGAGVGLFEGEAASKKKKQAFEEQVKQEQLRKTQMENDARRETLEVQRKSQQAASIAESNATLAGASTGRSDRQSSNVGGAAGGLQGAGGVATNSIYQNLQIGEGLFSSNLKEGYLLNESQAAQGRASLFSDLSKIALSGKLDKITGGFNTQTDQTAPNPGLGQDNSGTNPFSIFEGIY